MWQSGAGQPPNVLNLSVGSGQNAISVAAIVQGASSDGSVNVFATDATRVFFDINGYFASPGGAGALLFHPVAPCRVIDTTINVTNASLGGSPPPPPPPPPPP